MLTLSAELEVKVLGLELKTFVVVIVVEVAAVVLPIVVVVVVPVVLMAVVLMAVVVMAVVVMAVVVMAMVLVAPSVSAAIATVTGESGRCKQAGQRKESNRNQSNDDTIHGTDSKARWGRRELPELNC